LDQIGNVHGTIQNVDGTQPVYAAAYDFGETAPRLVDFQLVPERSPYVFALPAQRFHAIASFQDRNEDWRRSRGKSAAFRYSPQLVSLGNNQRSLTANLSLVDWPNNGFLLQLPRIPGSARGSLGQVASLIESRFSSKEGERGLWEPNAFLRDHFVGTYFLEPYGPTKIPVLFVHGAAGSPQDFRYLMSQPDRRWFQPWFYHCPSGHRLERSAGGISEILKVIQERLGFTQMHVVAHSMGGLVACRALLRNPYEDRQNFLTLSTSWNGHGAAQMDARRASTAVASWCDVQTNSDFIQGLFKTRLPSWMTYGFPHGNKSSRWIWLPTENDGSVGAESELDVRALQDARRVLGLPYGHTEILNRPEVARTLNNFLTT